LAITVALAPLIMPSRRGTLRSIVRASSGTASRVAWISRHWPYVWIFI